MRPTLAVLAVALSGILPCVPAASASEVLLTVTAAGDAAPVQLDLQALSAMTRIEFDTTTPWTDGKHHFTGVPLKEVLASAGITEGTVRAVALNDYAVDLPVAELDDAAPIVAYHLDGQPFGIRQKGPLWIVYPFDEDSRYQSETAYGRSVWQLNRLLAR